MTQSPDRNSLRLRAAIMGPPTGAGSVRFGFAAGFGNLGGPRPPFPRPPRIELTNSNPRLRIYPSVDVLNSTMKMKPPHPGVCGMIFNPVAPAIELSFPKFRIKLHSPVIRQSIDIAAFVAASDDFNNVSVWEGIPAFSFACAEVIPMGGLNPANQIRRVVTGNHPWGKEVCVQGYP